MTPTGPQRQQQGFTLLEMVLSLSLFALLGLFAGKMLLMPILNLQSQHQQHWQQQVQQLGPWLNSQWQRKTSQDLVWDQDRIQWQGPLGVTELFCSPQTLMVSSQPSSALEPMQQTLISSLENCQLSLSSVANGLMIELTLTWPSEHGLPSPMIWRRFITHAP